MDEIKKLEGSVSVEDFVRGLLLASKDNSLGEMWEKCVSCPNCLFEKQCGELSEMMEARGQNPQCGQVIDILLGDLSPDDESIPRLSEWEDDEEDEEE